MSEGLERAAARLRGAIAAGDFRPALALLPEFRRELDTALAGAPAGGPEAVAVATAARDLLAWARCATLCAQAHVAAQLEALACAGAYTIARPPRRRWEMDG